MDGTPFSYLAHLVTLLVWVGGVEARFALDTGIGPTIVTVTLARELWLRAERGGVHRATNVDARHAAAVGIRRDDFAVRRVEGRDEPGHAYVRSFTRLHETIHVTARPRSRRPAPT
jgi:hypothetical protein